MMKFGNVKSSFIVLICLVTVSCREQVTPPKMFHCMKEPNTSFLSFQIRVLLFRFHTGKMLTCGILNIQKRSLQK